MLVFRNQAYQARVQLAVLDHNAHVTREPAINQQGVSIYHRKYRKQSKKWDVTPMKLAKKYTYIPELISSIFQERLTSYTRLKDPRHICDDEPTHIQSTIAHTAPDVTEDIVKSKRSRFK